MKEYHVLNRFRLEHSTSFQMNLNLNLELKLSKSGTVVFIEPFLNKSEIFNIDTWELIIKFTRLGRLPSLKLTMSILSCNGAFRWSFEIHFTLRSPVWNILLLVWTLDSFGLVLLKWYTISLTLMPLASHFLTRELFYK